VNVKTLEENAVSSYYNFRRIRFEENAVSRCPGAVFTYMVTALGAWTEY
jgi:hypothetical protein